jgi:hypothetical protein
MRRTTIAALLTLAALPLLAGCGDDDDAAGDDGTGPSEVDGEADEAGGEGTVAVHLEATEGIFVEGFEVALRFETGDGEVLDSLLWTEFVAGLGDQSIEAFYDSVLEQPVPAGPVVVHAEVALGIGPPPVPPDPTGELACRLEVDVPDGGTVEVEVAFTDADCLREV